MHDAILLNKVTMEKMLLANKVGRFLQVNQDGKERTAVEVVAHSLAGDGSEQVRSVLSHALVDCASLPNDLVRRIVLDAASIAGPFLEFSKCLDDEMIAQLVPEIEDAAMRMLASRHALGEKTTDRIIHHGTENTVTRLMQNIHLTLVDHHYTSLLNVHGDSMQVMDQLGMRANLPTDVAQKIIASVSDECRDTLIGKYDLNPDSETKVVQQSYTETLWAKISAASDKQVHNIAVDLHRQNRLDHALILSLAEKGSVTFFESGLALLGGVSLIRVRDILRARNATQILSFLRTTRLDSQMGVAYLKLVSLLYGEKAA